MSYLFYQVVRAIGRPVIFSPARKVVLHEERARLAGGCLLAANHDSYFDSTVLVATTTRMIDWLSIVELFRGRWQRIFMEGMNCLPLNRRQPDAATTRELIRRVRRGKMVGLFPEAELRRGGDSVLYGGSFAEGIGRLAELTRAPVLPVIVLGAAQFQRPRAWIPGSRTPLMINYGRPIRLEAGRPRGEARRAMEAELRRAFPELFAELKAHPFWQECRQNRWWREQYPEQVAAAAQG